MKTTTASLWTIAASMLATLLLRAEVPSPAYHWAMDNINGFFVNAASDASVNERIRNWNTNVQKWTVRGAEAYNAVTNCAAYTGSNIQIGSSPFTVAASLQTDSRTKRYLLAFGNGKSGDTTCTNGFALATGDISDEIRVIAWSRRDASAVKVVARFVVPGASRRLHHYALAFDAPDSDAFRAVRIYVDGRYAARGTLALPEMYSSYPMQFTSLQNSSDSLGYGQGANIVVDDLAIYQAALTAEQVTEIASTFPVWPTEDYAGMYVYVGNGASLNEPSSWMLNGETPESAPGNQDVAVFPSDVTVALDEDVSISNVVLFANLTLTSTSSKAFKFHLATGPGRFILAPAAGSTVDIGQLNGQGGASMYTGVEFNGEGQGRVCVYDGKLDWYGSAFGSGKMTLVGGNSAQQLLLYGDNSEFAGTALMTYNIWGKQTYPRHQFKSPFSGSALAKWTCHGNGATDNGNMDIAAGDVIRFGEYNVGNDAKIRYNNYAYIVEVGALGAEGVIGNAQFPGANMGFRKVGSGTQKCHAWNYGFVKAVEGDWVFTSPKSGNLPKSYIAFEGGRVRYEPDQADAGALNGIGALIKNSTAAIRVGLSAGQNATWGALDESNAMHEIELSGTGTLTLSEVPAWNAADATTKITVAEGGGSVVVPDSLRYTLGKNTIVKSGESGTLVFSNGRPGLILIIK